MSKEYLEALEHIYYGSQGYGETDKYYKYLKEFLESIDNANPSEALDMLEGLKNGLVVGDKSIIAISMGYFDKAYTTIKQALLKAQEQEKVLEIAFKKRIDLESFYTVFVDNGYYSYNYYEKTWGTYGEYELTHEEFDLLKAYFEKNIQKVIVKE